MKGRFVGWLLSAVFIVAVVAIAVRVPMVKRLVFGEQPAAA